MHGKQTRRYRLECRLALPTAETLRPARTPDFLSDKGCYPPRLCAFPSKFAASRVNITLLPRPKWTNPRDILSLPPSCTATPGQLAVFSGSNEDFDAVFAVLKRGTTVLSPVFAVFERGISSICGAMSFLHEGIAASCRGFAALPCPQAAHEGAW